jgi:uncharacterized protein (DUF2236 family)
MRDISQEGILLAAGGRALLLQIAHPAVGAGVARHSDFANDPLSRLHGTLTFIYAIASGTEEDAAAIRRTVNRAHVPVRGDGYNAMDGQLQLWVAATLYDSAITMYERVYGPLSPDDAESVYREYAILGTSLQMPASLWPADRAAFAAYWAASLEGLSVSVPVKGVQEQIWRPGTAPVWVRVVMPLVRFVTAGLLPSSVRGLFELSWTSGQQRRFDRLLRVTAFVYPKLPVAVRHWPQRYYLRRLRLL